MLKQTLHNNPGGSAVEATSDSILIHDERDVIPLMEALYDSGARRLILHQENISPEFFDLSTGLAGAVLQKFVNYGMKVAFVGDFSIFTSKALKAFIYESNRGNEIFFVDSVESALGKFKDAG